MNLDDDGNYVNNISNSAHPKHFSVNCLKNRIVWIGFNVIILEEERIYDNYGPSSQLWHCKL